MILALAKSPFLIVLDGLDECDNKDEVQELIEGMLAFFDDNPLIPLRVFITSRVEQHIQSHLDVPGVRLDNLVDHCSDADIITFLDVLFKNETRRNPVIRAYIAEHGEWPPPNDRHKLVNHIGGSFIFASTVFKFIMESTVESDSPATPMDRLPLALKMNPGLDELYMQTLARSQHLPHFPDIISTIALLEKPLPTSGIAELLGISTYKVVNVLVNLQAIIQVPGTDDIPVTLFHTSLRDYLTTQSRSGRFFAHPRHHVRLFLRFLQCEFVHRQHRAGSLTNPIQLKHALHYSVVHLNYGKDLFEAAEFDSAIQLYREMLGLYPSEPELIQSLARVTIYRAKRTASLVDLEEGISLSRQVLEFRPSSHPDHSDSLRGLGNALRDCYLWTRAMADLEEAISLYCETLELRPSPHPGRSLSLSNLGIALLHRYRRTGTVADLEEAISLHREALELEPPPHHNRSVTLHNLCAALQDRYQRTATVADLEEAISLYREALELRPSPHPNRPSLLNSLGSVLQDCYERTGTVTDLEEAASLYRESLELRSPHHPRRASSLTNLGYVLQDFYRRTGTVTDLEEAISLHREALKLRPSSHPHREVSLTALVVVLHDMYELRRMLPDLQEAILHSEELLASHHPVGHQHRLITLDRLASLLQTRFSATPQAEDLAYIERLEAEARQLSTLISPS
ncbi:hypothetical protein H1R20_g3006, partial [Candolleomyces eurysporus]